MSFNMNLYLRLWCSRRTGERTGNQRKRYMTYNTHASMLNTYTHNILWYMHACHSTWAYISGYGAHAGPNNGQATKGNGMLHLIYSTSVHVTCKHNTGWITRMHVIEHEPIFQVMVLTQDQTMDKQPKETVCYIHACYIHIKHVCNIIYNMLLLAYM